MPYRYFFKTSTKELNMKNIDCNIHNLIINDFALIPIKLRKENRFCLWKYERLSSSTTKFLKKPYGINSVNQIIPSLQNKQYWFNLDKLQELSFEIQQKYGLGIILNDGPYVVIDLDNCISIKNNQFILLEEAKQIIQFFPKAYCEISPSNTGVHIIFRGTWITNCNKSKRYISESLKQGTIEIYSGYDCRYITLTGNSIYNKLIQNSLPYYSFMSESLQKIYVMFFLSNERSYIPKSLPTKSLIKNSDHHLIDKYLFIRNNILCSNYKKVYLDLCELNNPNDKYKSTSEADWSYFGLVFRFLSSIKNNEEKITLLKYFFQKDRPERQKKYNESYIQTTLKKVLNVSSYNQQMIQKYENIPEENKQIYDNKIDKKYILKICNVMKIFYLGRTTKNFEYIHQNENNYLKVISLVSLNQNDLVNYFEILDQVFSSIKDNSKSLKDYCCIINIQRVLKNTNKTISGKSYQNFINTVDKLSHVILEYDKQIHTNGLRSKKVGSLLTYEYEYYAHKLNYSKKLLIRVHPSIIDIFKESNYNYAIFNKMSFYALEINELKLLYYYFCLSTLPGSFSKEFSIDDLLKLWSKSDIKQTISKRKKMLINLLLKLEQDKAKISDLDILIKKNGNKIVGVNVQKKQLRLV